MGVYTLWKTIARASRVLLVCMPLIAFAQEPADPPSRVARLNYFDGGVTFAPAGTDDWTSANINRPLTTGDRLWVDNGSRSELHVGSTALRMGDYTGLTILELTDENTQLMVTEGTLNVRVRHLDGEQSFEIQTPNMSFSLQTPGEYRVDVDPTSDRTTVTVRRGNGIAYATDDSHSLRVQDQQQIDSRGSRLEGAMVVQAPPYDRFDDWTAQRDYREDKSVSARYVSREMTGYEALDANGSWVQDADYGPVWIPKLTVSNWAPYRDGHWAWVEPWGWTWVDDASWGFAPFHYGRWARVRNTWAWVPGPANVRPVYAPALVAFVGGNSGGVSWNLSVSSGSAGGVAWFPLAPGEAYRPAYHASTHYINSMNVVNKHIANQIPVEKNEYRNQQYTNAVTAMPSSAFVRGHSARKDAINVRAGQFEHSQVISSPDLKPVREVERPQAAAPHQEHRIQQIREPHSPQAGPRPDSGGSVGDDDNNKRRHGHRSDER